ncbi:RNA methyltransferase [bacterium]|nr:RNA methyltransferase [bacterium]
MQKILILDHIRSAYNVGSIFRTADGAGVEKIYLLGYTPAPEDRFGRPHTEIIKTSLGACSSVRWEQVEVENLSGLIRRLKHDGYEVVAIEQTDSSIDMKNWTPKDKTVFILGNEVDGVSKKLLALTDEVVEIKMKGKKESLNVSVAAGITLFH